MSNLHVKDVVIPIIKSIDLFNFLLKNHHRRTAIIAYNIGKAYGLKDNELGSLVLSAAIHDIGALNVEERDKLIEYDVENPLPHSVLGYEMLKTFRYFEPIAEIIRYHHIKYHDPESSDVPIQCHILHLADRVDVLLSGDEFILFQKNKVIEYMKEHSETIFHPEVVKAFLDASKPDIFWIMIEDLSMEDILEKVDVCNDDELNEETLEEFAYTLSRVIDFRSHFTASHSYVVGILSQYIGSITGLDEKTNLKLKIAGFLHDIGKLGIDNRLIEKPGKLTSEEYTYVKQHSYFTGKILSPLNEFEEIKHWTKHHHEKVDGSGYPYGIKGDSLDEGVLIIAYADIISALTEDRPYRKKLSIDEAFKIIEEHSKEKLSPYLFNILEDHKAEIEKIILKENERAISKYKETMESYNKYTEKKEV